MSTNTDSDSAEQTSEDEQIDPRFETPFGSTFADSPMKPNEIGEILADIHNNREFKYVIEYYIDHYLENNYPKLDHETREIVTDIMAKEAQSGLFPYRNYLLDADGANIEPADRVFRHIDSTITTDYDEPIVKEYEVKRIQEHGTEALLMELAHYDMNGELLDERWGDRKKRSYLDVNVAQLRYDEKWFVLESLNERGGVRR